MSTLVISTNSAGLNAHRNLKVISSRNEKASERLSSGFRINRAGDDAAGLAISEKMRSQIVCLRKASENVNDAGNLFATGDGALGELSEITGRIRELAVNAMNDTNEDEDRQKMDEEVKQLVKEFDAICEKTEFNKFEILRGKIEKYDIGNLVASNYAIETLQEKNIVQNVQKTYVAGGALVENDVQFQYDGYIYRIDFERELLKHDPDFFKFLTQEMYAPDNTVSAKNKERFRSVVEKAINSGIRSPKSKTKKSGVTSTEAAIPDIIVAYTTSGKLAIGTEQGLTFDVFSNGCYPGASGSFGHTFLHMNYNAGSEVISLERNKYSDKELYVQMGANTEQGHLFTWKSCSSNQAGLKDASVATRDTAELAMRAADNALKYVVDIRTRFGSFMNRLEHTEKNLDVATENLCSSESRIRNTDMAKEMMEFTKTSILNQAGLAMLSQANGLARNVLSVLQ